MDTVIMRLHNIQSKYPPIWHMGQQTVVGTQLMHTKAPRPKESVDTVMKFFLNYREQSAVPIRFSDKVKVASSNHDIVYWLDQQRDFLEINVSIPKYLFGNNVLEVITPPSHKDYSVNQQSPYSQVTFWYRLIKEVARNIIDLIVRNNYVNIDWNDFEIARMDIAVNQIHQGKPHAIKHLKFVQGVHKRFQRKNATGRQVIYQDETVVFPSEHYNVKIYHKGTEFANIQAKHIIKLNKQRQKDAKEHFGQDARLLSSNIKYSEESIQELQILADKILRYEFTFRPEYMSYIFNRKMNKHWSKDWASFKRIYDYLQKDVDNKKFMVQHRVMYVDSFGGECTPELAAEKKYFVEDNYEHGFVGSGHWKTRTREFTSKEYLFMRVLRRHGIVDRKDLKNWEKRMERELNKVHQFRWKIDSERDTMVRAKSDKDGNIFYLNNAMTITPKFVRFSRTVIKFMLTELEKFFNNFQVDTKLVYSEFSERMDKWNADLEDKMLLATGAERDRLEKLVVKPRTQRALIEFNNLFSKLTPIAVKARYQKTQYFRLLKLHKAISGQQFQVSSQEFGEVNKDFQTIYKQLHLELQRGYLLKFYNTAFAGHYVIEN